MERTPEDHILADELLIIRHSGEIPEVALHGSIFFLTSDPHGPRYNLGREDLKRMKEQVVARYQEMLERDLQPDNRGKTFYRGLARAVVNWQRLAAFCQREGIGLEPSRGITAKLLILFIKKETEEVAAGRTSSVNCGLNSLGGFAGELGVAPGELPAGWQEICRKDQQYPGK